MIFRFVNQIESLCKSFSYVTIIILRNNIYSLCQVLYGKKSTRAQRTNFVCIIIV